MEKRYSARRFSMSDISEIIELQNLVFKYHHTLSEEWWRWKYQKNPAGFWGEQGDIWVAEDKGKIVGHYALIPIKVKMGIETILAGQSVDIAVHPEYRRMGILSTLARKVYADVRDRYSFLFAYPSEMGHKGLMSLGWKDYAVNELTKFIRYERPLKSYFSNKLYASAAKTFLKTWQGTQRVITSMSCFNHKFAGEDVTMERVDKFEDELDAFWRIRRNDSTVAIERSVLFLNWRFSKVFGDYQIWVGKSAKDGRVLGYVVLRRMNRKTRLGRVENALEFLDLCGLPEEEKFLMSAMDLGLKIGEKSDADLIRIRIPVWHRHAKIIRNRGFINTASILSKVGIYQPTFISYDFEGRHVAPNLNNWYYSLADVDPI
jgi:GNAT superfamily N-acetyltransferase